MCGYNSKFNSTNFKNLIKQIEFRLRIFKCICDMN